MNILRYTIDALREQFPDDDACLDFTFVQEVQVQEDVPPKSKKYCVVC